MYQYQYDSARELCDAAEKNGLKISEAAMRHEAERDGIDISTVRGKMKDSLSVMRANIKTGIASTQPSIGGLIGKNAAAMHQYSQRCDTYGGAIQSKAIAYALAVTEENSRMKCIVACPTAGACGVVPGSLIAACEESGKGETELIDAMFNASAVGIIIAHNASISGAEAGCQAEVGAASAMAASALTELAGGSVNACLNAAAIALKNVMGLVCDPVAGLVEVPCSKRNAMGVANAIAAADMALAGITSVIPLDEVVNAMKKVGLALPFELKETAKGGVAATKTGKAIHKTIKKRTDEILSHRTF